MIKKIPPFRICREMTKKTILLVSLLGALPAFAAPLKVYILSGQSNMQGHANVSTFDYMAKDPKTAPLLKTMQDSDGKPVVADDVWISYLSEARGGEKTVKKGKLTAGFGASDDRIGPEFTFGLAMDKHHDEPVLLIKTAWGGKSLHADFRPPSASSDEAGKYYQLMVEHVNKVLEDPKQVVPDYNAQDGYEIAGFVWFQGWNDMVNGGVYPNRNKAGGYGQYSEYLAHFIRDVRKEFKAPEMPFVIGVLGVNGPTEMYESPRYKGVHQNFRDAMAAPASMPEFKGNVAAVLTEKFWDHKLDEARSKKKDERTAEDEEILKGASNQGFHYYGAAKIMAPIGKAFADAMIEMQ